MIRKLKYLAVFILTLSFASASAQFGVRAKYNMNSFDDWNQYISENVNGDSEDIFSSNIELGLDYWFRLKTLRIEFMPEVAMGLKTNSMYPAAGAETSFSYFAFNMNTQLYLFDFKGDCDCPTFSKQGPSLKKGFFFSVTPGLLLNSKEISTETSDPSFSSNHLNFRLGVGAGFDIGISDLFTISPSISYMIAPGMNFNDLAHLNNGPVGGDVIKSGLSQIQLQIRLGFRPDYVKSYGRRR